MNDLFNMFLQPVISMINSYKEYLIDGVTTKEKAKNGIILYIQLFFIFKSGNEKTDNDLLELQKKLTEWAIKTIEDFNIKGGKNEKI